ncbi:hypothetical protein NQ318_003240 [Aromia moschata]|uniref:Uncharacterized protein n=1 Tax=Aromia moschata TaxID=1265417 RepID=A0AAV8YQJ1_9CUCU|nr:hypothetical protein NQ318_003240 [Aromia moschata]
MSGLRLGMSQMNGNNRRPPNISRMSSNDKSAHAQHDEIIKYIYESWSKVEMDRGSNSVRYYQDEGAHHLKDFQPFDLEAYWGRRLHQNVQQQHS